MDIGHELRLTDERHHKSLAVEMTDADLLFLLEHDFSWKAYGRLPSHPTIGLIMQKYIKDEASRRGLICDRK